MSLTDFLLMAWLLPAAFFMITFTFGIGPVGRVRDEALDKHGSFYTMAIIVVASAAWPILLPAVLTRK